MSAQFEHEHWFFDHEDPRYLICDCGQYAVRTRNNAGERIFRLIDPPRPVLQVTVTDLSDCPARMILHPKDSYTFFSTSLPSSWSLLSL